MPFPPSRPTLPGPHLQPSVANTAFDPRNMNRPTASVFFLNASFRGIAVDTRSERSLPLNYSRETIGTTLASSPLAQGTTTATEIRLEGFQTHYDDCAGDAPRGLTGDAQVNKDMGQQPATSASQGHKPANKSSTGDGTWGQSTAPGIISEKAGPTSDR